MIQYAAKINTLIKYNGKDISKDISQYLKSLSYNDELDGVADDVSIVLEDRASLWQSDWMPEKGATLDISLISTSWERVNGEVRALELGIFEIDEVNLKSAPNEVTIKAVSVPNATTLRGVEHSRSWEKVDLKKVAQDIADGAKVKLFYDTAETIQLDRVEQSEEADLAFLHKLCSDNGLSVKVFNDSIVIFDTVKYEAQPVKLIFRKNGYVPPKKEGKSEGESPKLITEFENYSFTTAIRDVYKECKVSHKDGKDKALIEATFTDPNKKIGKTLIVHTQVKDTTEAMKVAKKELRKKNEDEVKASLSLRGNFDLAAGVTCQVEGFGYFDGKYILTKVGHNISGAYSCGVDIRRCLEEY
nr:MAG TPA: tail protein [Caudoviricetes sp.]